MSTGGVRGPRGSVGPLTHDGVQAGSKAAKVGDAPPRPLKAARAVVAAVEESVVEMTGTGRVAVRRTMAAAPLR